MLTVVKVTKTSAVGYAESLTGKTCAPKLSDCCLRDHSRERRTKALGRAGAICSSGTRPFSWPAAATSSCGRLLDSAATTPATSRGISVVSATRYRRSARPSPSPHRHSAARSLANPGRGDGIERTQRTKDQTHPSLCAPAACNVRHATRRDTRSWPRAPRSPPDDRPAATGACS